MILKVSIVVCSILQWLEVCSGGVVNTPPQFPMLPSSPSSLVSSWTLPSTGFPHFYRYFRDEISWFEADAVCQFHHANLATVNNPDQFDAARDFLKEHDVQHNVWIGLMRNEASETFKWANTEDFELASAYWAEELPVSNVMLCAAIDPTRDYRWHALRCDGTYTASFLCEMRVPDWANACTNLIQFKNTSYVYDSETGNIHIVHECSKNVVKTAVCGINSNNDADIQRQLTCDDEAKAELSAASSTTDKTATAAVDTSTSPLSGVKQVGSSKLDDLRPLLADPTVKQPKPIKTGKKPSWKKLSVANKKYSKIPKFVTEIIADDELMQGDEPVKTIEEISTPANGVTTSTGSLSTEGGEISTENFASTSLAASYSLETESYESSSEDSTAAEARTRREIVAPESSTQPMMAVGQSGSYSKKYSHHAKADFDKYDFSQYKGVQLGKSNPQLYSPQVMRKEFNRPEIMNITTQRSEDKPKTPDMFVPPLLMVKSHFPYYPTHIDTNRDPLNREVIPENEPVFNETFYENENATDDATTEATVASEEIISTTITATSSNSETTEPNDVYTHLVENKIEAKLAPEDIEMLPVAEALKAETTEATVTATTGTEQSSTPQQVKSEESTTFETTEIISTSTVIVTSSESDTIVTPTVEQTESTTGISTSTELVTEENESSEGFIPKIHIIPSTVFPQDLIVLQEGLRKRSVTNPPEVLVTSTSTPTTSQSTASSPKTEINTPSSTTTSPSTVTSIDVTTSDGLLDCGDEEEASTTTTEKVTTEKVTSAPEVINNGNVQVTGEHKIVKKDHRSCMAEFAHGKHDQKPTARTHITNDEAARPHGKHDQKPTARTVIINEGSHVQTVTPRTTKAPSFTLGDIVTGTVTHTPNEQHKSSNDHHSNHHSSHAQSEEERRMESSLNNADYEEHGPKRHRVLTQEPPSNFLNRVFG